MYVNFFLFKLVYRSFTIYVMQLQSTTTQKAPIIWSLAAARSPPARNSYSRTGNAIITHKNVITTLVRRWFFIYPL